MKRKKKIIPILFILLVCWIIAAGNNFNADYDAYVNMYEWSKSSEFGLLKMDFGFNFFMSLFANAGIPFQSFRIILYAICLSLIVILCYKEARYPLIVLLSYIVIHFLRDIVETRNFLATIFLLYTVFFYRKCTRNYIYLIILLLTAFSIHMSFILYFPFILIGLFKRIHYWRMLVICSFFSVFARFFVTSGVDLLMIDGLQDKVSDYSDVTTTFALPLSVCLAIYNGICVSYFNKIKNRTIEPNKNYSLVDYGFVMNNMNSISCLFLIFSPFNFSFYARLFGNIILLNMIYFTNILSYSKKKNTGVILIVFYVLLFAFFTQINPFILHLSTVFNNNIFF